ILPIGGIECLANAQGQYVGLVPPGTPGAITDSLGQTCIDVNGPPPPGATVSRTFYDNIPADVKGVELEFQLRPVDALTIEGNFGYTDFEGDEQDDPSLLGPTVGALFTDLPIYVPELNWSVSAAWRFGMTNGGALTTRLDLYGQSDICPTLRTDFYISVVDTTEEEQCTQSFELLNVRLQWDSASGGWMAAVG